MSLVLAVLFKKATLGALFSPFWVRLFLAFVDGKVRIFGVGCAIWLFAESNSIYTTPIFS